MTSALGVVGGPAECAGRVARAGGERGPGGHDRGGERRDRLAIGILGGDVDRQEPVLGHGGGGGCGDHRGAVRVGDGDGGRGGEGEGDGGGERDAVTPCLGEIGRPGQRAAGVARARDERGPGGQVAGGERSDRLAVGIGGGDVDRQERVLGHGDGGGRRDDRGTIRVGDGDDGRGGAGERVAGGDHDAVASRLGEIGRQAQRAGRVARARGERGPGGPVDGEPARRLSDVIGGGDVDGEERALGHGGGGGCRDHRGAVRVGNGDGGRAGAGERVAGGERDAVAPRLGEIGGPGQRAGRIAGAGGERGACGHAGCGERGDRLAVGVGGGDVGWEERCVGQGGGGGRRDHRSTVRVRDRDDRGVGAGERVAGREQDAIAAGLGEVGGPAERAGRVARAGSERGPGGQDRGGERRDRLAIGVGGGHVHGHVGVLGHGGGSRCDDHRSAVRVGDGDGGRAGAGAGVGGGKRHAVAPALGVGRSPAERAGRVARAGGERGPGGKVRGGARRGRSDIGVVDGDVDGQVVGLGHGGGGGCGDHRGAVRVGDGDGGRGGAGERVAGRERDAVTPCLVEVGRPGQRPARVARARDERGTGGQAGRRERRDGIRIGIGGGDVDRQERVLGHGDGGGRRHDRGTVGVGDGDCGRVGAGKRIGGGEDDAVASRLGEAGGPAERAGRVARARGER